MCVYVYVCAYVCVCECVYVCVYVCVCEQSVYMHNYVCVCVYLGLVCIPAYAYYCLDVCPTHDRFLNIVPRLPIQVFIICCIMTHPYIPPPLMTSVAGWCVFMLCVCVCMCVCVCVCVVCVCAYMCVVCVYLGCVC